MAKRQANKDLNHENWDDEDEEEDPGHFVPVNESELQRRVIKKAKRFGVKTPSSASSSPFAAFSGFSSNAKSNSSTFGTFGNSMTMSPSSQTSKPFASSFGSSATMSTFFAKSDSAKSFGTLEPDKSIAKSCVNTTEDDKILSKPIATVSTSVVAATETKEKQNGNSTQQSHLSLDTGYLRNMEYYRQLKSLNESVIKWMQLHLSKNVCCDFSPVFNDYTKHLDTLNVTYPAKRKATSPPQPIEPTDNFNFKRPSTGASSTSASPKISSSNNNSAGSLLKNTTSSLKDVTDEETDYGAHFASNTTNTSTFSFGMKNTTTGTSSITPKGPTTTSEEGEANEQESSPTSTTPFSFQLKNRTDLQEQSLETKDTKPFSFACSPITQRFQSESSAESEPQNPEYQPPKNDFTAVAEEGASYSKKCKLFFKKDQNYADKGVGTLYLKPLGEKMQLIIRADTNLGNILLNIMLNDTLPVTRMSKNNVLIVCVPNPPLDTKNPDSKDAIPMLIRVKTDQDADELFERLKKYMKS